MQRKLKAKLKALARPLLRPPIAAAALAVAAAAAVVLALFADARISVTLSLLMSLVTLVAVAAVWAEARRTRVEVRAANDRNEVAFRRILAAIEVERLANERRHASAPVLPLRDQGR